MPDRLPLLACCLLPTLLVAVASRTLDAQSTARWTVTKTGRFESKTYPSTTAPDLTSVRREANAIAKRWIPTAKLFKIDFRSEGPIALPASGDRGMFEAYFYYFASDATQWKGLLVSANMAHGFAQLPVSSETFNSNPPVPAAAPSDPVDPIEGLRRLNLSPDGFLKAGIHLKAAGSPSMTAINFGLSNGEFERYIDRTLPAGQWVWWTEVHPGTGKNTYVFIDAVTGRGTVATQLR